MQGDLRGLIKTVIKEHLKDREVVEIETAHAVAKKAWEWAELLAKFGGVLLTTLVLSLAFFGYQNIKDVEQKGEMAKANITNLMAQLADRSAQVQARLGQVESNLVAASELPSKVNALTKQLSAGLDELIQLTNRLNSVESTLGEYIVSGDASTNYEAFLRPFRLYLGVTNRIETVATIPAVEFRYTVVKGKEWTQNAYAGQPAKIVMGVLLYNNQQYRDDPDFLRCDYAWHLLSSREQNGVPSTVATSLTYYYPASFMENPVPFPVYERLVPQSSISMVNSYQISDHSNDDGAWWTNSVALAGLFWEMRGMVGKTQADQILGECWNAYQKDFRTGDRHRGITKFLEDISAKLRSLSPALASAWQDRTRQRISGRQ